MKFALRLKIELSSTIDSINLHKKKQRKQLTDGTIPINHGADDGGVFRKSTLKKYRKHF